MKIVQNSEYDANTSRKESHSRHVASEQWTTDMANTACGGLNQI